MAQVINSNVASLNSQRNLNTSQSSLATSLQRMSSGLRINSAKDDAAGLAISERMTSQIRGLNQAVRNANDGISLAQTAEGALGEIGNNLQRVRELAIQSRNASNSDEDRQALQKEAAQLLSEIDRVADQTTFNGTKLLNGSFTNQAFQVGAEQGQTINISSIADANIAALGTWTSVATPATVSGTAAALTGSGYVAPSSATPATKAMGAFTAASGGSADAVLTTTFTAGATSLAISTSASATVSAANLASAYVTAGFVADGTGTVSGFSLDLGGDLTIEDAITNGNLTVQRADGVDFTYAESVTGTTAYTTDGGFNAAPTALTTDGAEADSGTPGSFTALGTGALTINGTDILVGIAADAATRLTDLQTAINAETSTTKVSATIVSGALTLTATDSTSLIVIGGTANTDQTGLTAATTPVVAGTAQVGFTSLDISDTEGADNAILAMDAAIKAVNSSRADLGAIQNRFSSVITNLASSSENLSAARSRIQDADFAAESANLTRAQILQQAGTAMLAQANALPQGVLSLLR